MSEHEIKSAFDHLRKDVMTGVKTEARLEQVTGRRRVRWQPALVAVGTAAVVALVIGAGILALLPGSDPEPGPPATSGSTTSIRVDTTATTVPTQTTLLPEPALGSVLIADIEAIPGSVGDGYRFYPGERVVGDGSGGVIFQADNRLIRVQSSGAGEDLVDGDTWTADAGPVTLRLEDLALVDGSPRVLFIVSGGSSSNPANPTAYQQVWWYDLDSGASAPIYTEEPAFESNISRVSQAGDVVVVTIQFEGGTYFEYLDAAGQPISIAAPFDGGLPGGVHDYRTAIFQGVVSPDGSELAYLEFETTQTPGADYFIDLVVWSFTTGSETQRIEILLPAGTFPGRMDFDGVGVVLGRRLDATQQPEVLTPLRIESLADGVVTELPQVGTPSLVKFDVR